MPAWNDYNENGVLTYSTLKLFEFYKLISKWQKTNQKIAQFGRKRIFQNPSYKSHPNTQLKARSQFALPNICCLNVYFLIWLDNIPS